MEMHFRILNKINQEEAGRGATLPTRSFYSVNGWVGGGAYTPGGRLMTVTIPFIDDSMHGPPVMGIPQAAY